MGIPTNSKSDRLTRLSMMPFVIEEFPLKFEATPLFPLNFGLVALFATECAIDFGNSYKNRWPLSMFRASGLKSPCKRLNEPEYLVLSSTENQASCLQKEIFCVPLP